MPQHVETVINALKHRHTDFLPRGELFIGNDFLGYYFPEYSGSYCKQIQKAAQELGVSLVGIDLNSGCSGSLFKKGSYKALGEFFTVGYINGPFADLIEKYGFKNGILSTKKEPFLISDIAAKSLKDLENKIKSARANGLNAICIADDIAGNRGLLFHLDYYSNILWPLYKKMAGIIKEYGMFAFFHSDGEMTKAIELLIEALFDCINPVDSQAGMDLYKLTQEFGQRVSFMGHIDIISWNEERIQKEVVLAGKSFQNGGLILGSTCGISMKTFGNKAGFLFPQWKKTNFYSHL